MPLKNLWALQELDLSIKSVIEKLENLSLQEEVEAARDHLNTLIKEAADLEVSIKEKSKYLKKIELDLQDNSDYRKELRDELYSGNVKNVKELEQMEKKLRSKEKEAQGREEEALELMQFLEDENCRLRELLEEKGAGERKLAELEKSLARDTELLEKELAGLKEVREKLAGEIKPDLIKRYLVLSRKHQGKALAVVNGDICSGCRVFISSAQRGALFNREAMVYCESCGRLLLKGDQDPVE